MKRLVLACAVLLCGPAFGNEREDSEAKLTALAGPVIAALEAAMPEVNGMQCKSADQDPSPTNRLLLPNWQATCSWTDDGAAAEAVVILVLSPSLATVTRDEIADIAARMEAGALPADHARFAGSPDVKAMRSTTGVKAIPSARVVALVDATGNRTEAAMDLLADALAGMDLAAMEAMPEVAAHHAALTAHRALLEGHVTALAAMLPPAVDGRDPTLRPARATFPDHMFFGFEPLVQVQAVEAGVAMTVTLTTSSFALENARLSGQFTSREKNGEMGADGVFHDRGRVQVYLRDNSMTALIDGRGMLMLYVPDEGAGTDPVAAMEAVLARISANDFSGY